MEKRRLKFAPKLLRPEIRASVIAALRRGLPPYLAAHASGISFDTLNRGILAGRDATSGEWFEFARDADRARAEHCAEFLDTMAAHAENHPGSARYMLDRALKAPDPFDTTPHAASDLESILAATVRLRKQAESSGSYTAAANLLAQEFACVVKIQERDAAERAAKAEDLTDEQAQAALLDALKALPEAVRAELVSKLAP